MTMSRAPILSAFLCALVGGLALLPAASQELLQFDYHRVMAGNWIGLLSGHWLHADGEHLLWNVGALAILATLIEARSRRLLLWSILVGMASVDLLLLSPLSDLARYCGLSGMLNTLLGVVLVLMWRATRSPLVTLVGALCILKIAVEMLLGQSLLTHISWPPFAPAHLAGIVATPIALLWLCGDTVTQGKTTRQTRSNHEYLVTSA